MLLQENISLHLLLTHIGMVPAHIFYVDSEVHLHQQTKKMYTYLTVMENSPGALSLRLTMNVPSG